MAAFWSRGWGGDSVLTEHGEEYASALAEWVDKEVPTALDPLGDGAGQIGEMEWADGDMMIVRGCE